MWASERFSCTFFIFTLTQSDWNVNLMDVVTEAFEVAESVLERLLQILNFGTKYCSLAIPTCHFKESHEGGFAWAPKQICSTSCCHSG